MPSLAEKQADEALEIALEFAETKLTLPQMIDHIMLEAHLIQGSERARLLGGLTTEPHPSQIDRVARHVCILKYLQRLHDQPQAAADHFQKIARQRRG